MILYIFFSLLLNQLNFSDIQGGDIDVTVAGISNQKGEIMIALFDSPEGFPQNARKAIKLVKGPAHKGDVVMHLKDVPSGRYAIALFHDTNGDAILNTNLLGIPKEGYGVSNNIKNKFSAPKFQQAAFVHGNSPTTLKIFINY